MTPGVFYGWLPHSLAPGASGESVAIQGYLWTLLATPFPLVPPDAAYNTIVPPDSPLIYSASRLLHGFPAMSHTMKGGTLGTNDWVVRNPPGHTLDLIIALITPACQ